MNHSKIFLKEENLVDKIHLIRNEKVILDFDIAELYGIGTKVLKQSVKRNIERFPEDFMFVLSKEEYQLLRSQIVTSTKGGTRYLPFAFTEQGVAMLSGILKSKRAIEVNIAIMRTFVQIRKLIYSHKDLEKKISMLETKYDDQFQTIFSLINHLISEKEKPKNRMGFG